MSLENAILELAASMRYLADSNRRDLAASAALISVSEKVETNSGSQVDPSMAQPSKPSKPAEVQPDGELETAVQKVEEAAAAEQPADLDYAKDVRPVLLAAIKKSGKPSIESLLAKFGVQKADQLQAKDFAAVLAEAQKLAA